MTSFHNSIAVNAAPAAIPAGLPASMRSMIKIADKSQYDFFSFRSTNSELSRTRALDGVSFYELPVRYTPNGTDAVRDPAVVKIGEVWWCVHTCPPMSAQFGTTKKLALAFSLDGGWNWTFYGYIDFTSVLEAGATPVVWAPGWVFDGFSYRIFASVGIDYVEGVGASFRIYEVHPTGNDFSAWSTPVALSWLNAPLNMIDPYVVKTNDGYYLFTSVGGLVTISYSTDLLTGWDVLKTGNWAGWGGDMEGQCVLRLGDGTWRIYLDNEGGGYYYATLSENFLSASAKTAIVNTDLTIQHGDVVAIADDEADGSWPSSDAWFDQPAGAVAGGLFFDFVSVDGIFTDQYGVTKAAVVNDPVAAVLDKHAFKGKSVNQYLASQSNVLSGQWTMSTTGSGTATESPSGVLNLTGDGNSQSARGDKSLTTVAFSLYCLEFKQPGGLTLGVRVGTTQGGSEIFLGPGTSVAGVNRVYFLATGTTTWLRLSKAQAELTVVSEISVKALNGNRTVQASSGQRPTLAANGLLFNGSTSLLSTYPVSATANLCSVEVIVPTEISSDQVIFGTANGASGAFMLGVDTQGRSFGAIGSGEPIKGSNDLRGRKLVLTLTHNASTVLLYEDDTLVSEAAVTGSPNTTYGVRIGGVNNAGTFASGFTGTIRRLSVHRKLRQVQQVKLIRRAMSGA